MTFKKPKTKFVYVVLVSEFIDSLTSSLTADRKKIFVRVIEEEGFAMFGYVEKNHDVAVNLARSIELWASVDRGSALTVAIVRVPDYSVRGDLLTVYPDRARFIFSFDPFNYKEVSGER